MEDLVLSAGFVSDPGLETLGFIFIFVIIQTWFVLGFDFL